jgi:hypothetical protein
MNNALSGCLLAALLLPPSLTAATEEHLLFPGYIARFEGDVAYDPSRSGGWGGVRSDTTSDGAPVRTVMEFALPAVSDPSEIQRATISILVNGGSRASGLLRYALFAYDGDGVLSVGEGLGGEQVAGPFEYDIDQYGSADLSRIDVLPAVRAAAAAGHSHIGFALRGINTEPNFVSDQQTFFAGANSFAGSRPPLLVVHTNSGEPASDAGTPLPQPSSPPQPASNQLASPQGAPVPQAAPAPKQLELGAASPAATVGGAVPKSYWPFDTEDYFNGYPTGTGQVAAPGALIGPGCYRGKGDGYFDSDATGPAADSPRSVSLWFRTGRSSGANDGLIGWGKWFQPNNSYERYNLRLAGSRLRLETDTTGHTFPLSQRVNDGRWHHALLSYSGGALSNHSLYVDGRFAGSPASGTVPNDLDTWYNIDVRIGGSIERSNNGDHFEGWIDDVAVYTEPLSALDAALLHGFGRHQGLALDQLSALHAFWSGSENAGLRFDDATWVKTSGLAGAFGDTGGSRQSQNAFIVLDDAGNGARIAPSANFDQLRLQDGNLTQTLGFGKAVTAHPVLQNTGDIARWQVLWENQETLLSLGNVARNLDRHADHFLDTVPDRHPFGGGEIGNSLGSESGFYYTTGNRIFFNGTQADYTGGAVVDAPFQEGVARYFTRNYGGLFALVADLTDITTIGVSGHHIAYRSRSLPSFTVTAPDGSAYRAFVTLVSDGPTTDVPALHRVTLVPDLPGVTPGALPESCRVYYLMFGRPSGMSYPELSMRQMVENFFQASTTGISWAWSGKPSDTIGGGTSVAVPIRLDTHGLTPGTYQTRYALAPEGTGVAEVPATAWHQISMQVGEPDFAIAEPELHHIGLAGGHPETLPVTLVPTGTSELTIMALSSDSSWLLPSISPSAPKPGRPALRHHRAPSGNPLGGHRHRHRLHPPPARCSLHRPATEDHPPDHRLSSQPHLCPAPTRFRHRPVARLRRSRRPAHCQSSARRKR